jgi:cytochrome c551/c552
MRRVLPLLAAAPLLLAGCGGATTASPSPQTVEGSFTLATGTQGGETTASPGTGGGVTTGGGGGGGATTSGGGGAAAGGGAADGKAIFASSGCGSCHTYKPAASSGMIGPDLDKLAQYAKQAKQPLPKFVETSIVNPKAYVQPGFQPVMPSYASLQGTPKLTALVKFLTTK